MEVYFSLQANIAKYARTVGNLEMNGEQQKMNQKIRNGKITDLNELTRLRHLFISLCSETDLRINRNYNMEELKKDVLDRLNNNKFTYFIAETDSKIIGYILLSKKEDFLFMNQKYGFINQFFVKEEFRGKGIGQKLLDASCNFFKENGIKEVLLDVFIANSNAMRFYYVNEFCEYNLVLKKEIK